MSVNNGDGVSYVTPAMWDALQGRCTRALVDTAQVRDQARWAKSGAVEQRLCSEALRLELDEARLTTRRVREIAAAVDDFRASGRPVAVKRRVVRLEEAGPATKTPFA